MKNNEKLLKNLIYENLKLIKRNDLTELQKLNLLYDLNRSYQRYI